MKKLLDLISEEALIVTYAQRYDEKYGRVTLSNRPDLCEYQCNGAMAAAKEYKCAPFMISDKIAEMLSGNEMFAMVESVKPGFLNLKIDENYLAKYRPAQYVETLHPLFVEALHNIDRVGYLLDTFDREGGYCS